MLVHCAPLCGKIGRLPTRDLHPCFGFRTLQKVLAFSAASGLRKAHRVISHTTPLDCYNPAAKMAFETSRVASFCTTIDLTVDFFYRFSRVRGLFAPAPSKKPTWLLQLSAERRAITDRRIGLSSACRTHCRLLLH